MYLSLLRMIGLHPTIAPLMLLTLLAHITVSGGRVASSLFVLQNGGSATAAGVIYSLYFLLPAVLSVPMGRWIDRVGSKRAMRLSLIGMVCSIAVSAIWPVTVSIFATAMISGLCFACYLLSANVAVAYIPLDRESDRVGMLAWLQIGAAISSVVGPTLVGIMIDGSGFRAAYVAMTAFVAAGLALCYRVLLPESHPAKDRVPGHGLGRLLREDVALKRIFFLMITISMAWEAFAFMTPLVGHARGYSATSIGFVLSAFAVGTFISRMSLPWLARHWSEWRTLSVACGITASVFFVLPWATDATVHAALGFVFGLSAGVCQPNILGLIYRTMPKGRAGEGAGLRSTIASFVGVITPSLYGTLVGFTGAAPVFLGIWLIMTASSWNANRGRKEDEVKLALAAASKD